MTSYTRSVRGGFRGFEKSQSWVLASEEDGWLSELADALRRVPHMAGGRWKSQHRKIVYLSPYVEKPFNSKVIKSFVPELRSRQAFFVFRDSYVIYVCALWTLWMFCVPVWICLFLVFISGYVRLRQSTQPPQGERIYCHPQTHCFVVYTYIYIYACVYTHIYMCVCVCVCVFNKYSFISLYT